MKRAFLFCALLAALPCSAQRNPWWGFYRQNWQLVNPAAVDRWYFMRTTKYPDYNWLLSGGGHLQWAGFQGAPATGFVSIEAVPVNNYWGNIPLSNARWGARVLFDQTDAFSTWNFAGNFCYAFLLPNSRGYMLSFATQSQVSTFAVNRSRLLLENPDDALVNFYDRTRWRFDAGFGAFLRANRRWYLGLSTPSLVGLARRPTDNRVIAGFEQVPQVDLMGGFYDVLGEGGNMADNAFLEYNCWLRYLWGEEFSTTIIHLPVSVDATMRLYIPEQFWVGIGQSTNGTASAEVGWAREVEHPRFAKKLCIWRVGLSMNYPVFYSPARQMGRGWGAELTVARTWSDRDK